MLSRFFTIVVFIPLAVVLIALAVANRAPAAFTIDPFNPGNPGLTITLPLFIYLFAALVIGLVIGSLATWFKQGRYRRLARERQSQSVTPSAQQAATPERTALPGPGA